MKIAYTAVIPAKAGIHRLPPKPWIPAFAGMAVP